MATPELRDPKIELASTDSPSNEVSENDTLKLDPRECAIRGLASSVLLSSGAKEVTELPVTAFKDAAKTATSWYPDQPIQPYQVRNTLLEADS